MPLYDGDAARSPAFIGRREGVGATQGKGGHDVERERRGVVVVNENDDVGLLLRNPFSGPFIACENRRPVRVRRSAAVECGADRRHMARANACGNPGH